MTGGWVYIMANRYRGTLYTGVTAYIRERVTQHRERKGSAFAKRYGCTILVHTEHYERIEDAIAREKAIKKWRRQWKFDLIETGNPDWDDRYGDLAVL